MNNELINIWKSDAVSDSVKIDKMRLLIELNSSLFRMRKRIKYRDLLDLVTSSIVLPIFAIITYPIPSPIANVGTTILLVSGAITIYKLAKNFQIKMRTEVDAPFLVQLRQSRSFLVAQCKLLSNLRYFFIIPFVVGLILICYGAGYRSFKLMGAIAAWVGIGLLLAAINHIFGYRRFQEKLSRVDQAIASLTK